MYVLQLLHHGAEILNRIARAGHVVLELVVGGERVEEGVGPRRDLVVDRLCQTGILSQTELLDWSIPQAFRDSTSDWLIQPFLVR